MNLYGIYGEFEAQISLLLYGRPRVHPAPRSPLVEWYKQFLVWANDNTTWHYCVWSGPRATSLEYIVIYDRISS